MIASRPAAHPVIKNRAAGLTRYTIDKNAGLSRLLVKHNPDGTKNCCVYGIYTRNKKDFFDFGFKTLINPIGD